MSIVKYFRTIAALSVFCVNGFSATGGELAGELPREVKADKSPYIIKADIFVPSGKAVRIEPGVVFLFNNFTGFNVQGVLTAKGTPLRPIVFTSSNDRIYSNDTLNPTPYDWNGIYIQKDGMGTVIENFKVTYSVKGIVSETKFINLVAGDFGDNGRSHCTIEGVEQQVTAGKPFSFTVSLKDATIDGVPVNILQDPQAVKRNTIRYSSLTVVIGSIAVGGIFGVQLLESQKKLSSLSSTDTSTTLHYTESDWTVAREKRDYDRTATIATALLAVAGGVGFYWTFMF
jgi:hypothetical protein